MEQKKIVFPLLPCGALILLKIKQQAVVFGMVEFLGAPVKLDLLGAFFFLP